MNDFININEAYSIDVLPYDVKNIIKEIQEIAKNVVLKSEFSAKARAINLYVYVKDRDTDSKEIANLLNKENGINVSTVKVATSSFPAHEFVQDGKTVRLIYKPSGSGGHHDTTINSTITELIPTLLFNSKMNVSSDAASMIEVANNYLNSNNVDGILSGDLESAKAFMDQIEESQKLNEKMQNAYAIYKWVLDYQSATSPIEKIMWAYRVKPEGIPKNTSADIILKHTDGHMIGVSLKAGTKSSKEPLLNSSIMNFFQYINKTEDEIKEILWNKIYSPIVTLYNNEVSQTKLDNVNYFSHGGNHDKTIFDVLEWYEKKYAKDYNLKYDELQSIIVSYLCDTANKSSDINDWMFDKMGLTGTFPVIIVKAIKDKAEEVKSSSKEEMATILANNKLNLVPSPTNKQFVTAKLNDGTTMFFNIRSKQPGVKHKLGSFYNLALMYVGRK
jgi:hypothetical protein